MKDTDAMLWFGGHWWWFSGAQIDSDSKFEWRDNRVYLLNPDASGVEGILLFGEPAP